MVHDAGRGGQDDVAELTRWQQADSPLLKIGQLDVVPGRDDTGLVETVRKKVSLGLQREPLDSKEKEKTKGGVGGHIPANQLDNDLAGAVVIDLLKLANVA